jgi:hypothetical protein
MPLYYRNIKEEYNKFWGSGKKKESLQRMRWELEGLAEKEGQVQEEAENTEC